MSSPEHAPAHSSNPGIRRSFTLPARIASKPAPSTSTGSPDGIETLFTYGSARIVSFIASAARRTSDDEQDASIPWRTPTERTLAVGVLRIYRVTSSNVSFLNSGNLLHTIFPKSQCWCVDGESVFVLRIRQDSYYRIELPFESDEDKEKTEQFKHVLTLVLQYEKTQCPFNRGFEVQLPQRPPTPPRKRARKPSTKAKKWLFDKTWMPENGLRPSTPVFDGSDSGTTSSYEEDDRSSINTDTPEVEAEPPQHIEDRTPPRATPARRLSVAERARLFQGQRSVSTPSTLGLESVTPAEMPRIEERIGQQEETPAKCDAADSPIEQSAETISHVSSVDSFHSLENSTHRSPSPPYLDAEADLINPWTDEEGNNQAPEEIQDSRGRGRHRRQVSEATLRARSEEHIDEAAPLTPTAETHPTTPPSINVHLSSAPSTPPLVSDSEEDSLEPPFLDLPTPPNTAIRLKRLTGATQRRAFSPMPHPQNLICPPSVQPRKQFTAALVRKTCELLLGPPSHLVTLMLRIAAKISNGAFGFNTYRVRSAGERIPCSWESSDEDEWEEDDFGIPLGNLDREGSALRRRGRSEDID
ncbi:hypothetical protein EJ04DRAFT_152502 [Polyplosphaeria fusca]|uniref:Inheritance of peroxisomes protein 1 n=1 Tax=Polyplosphaeria fusca TaxID=682080 RepID=A0A9P4QID5_9PLEO|nr:hypothetical protein EJ04DRAFT_152502 [Polyplosphaeria fusca]